MVDIPVHESTAETLVTATASGQEIFSFDFLVFTEDQTKVEYRPVTGTARELVLNTDYTVSGLNLPNGGSINLAGITVAVGDQLYIWRDTPIEREKDWQNEGDYKADLVNREQDEIYMIMQELRRGSTNDRKEIFDLWAALSEEERERIEKDNALASLIAQGGPIEVPVYDTRLAVTLANIKSTINSIRTAGYASVGDGGAALYKRVATEPSHAGKVKSHDGAWWELSNTQLDARMFGVRANGVADDTAAMVSAISTAKSTKRPLFLPRGVIMVDPDVLSINMQENSVVMIGSGYTPYMPEHGTVIRSRQAGNVLFRIDGFSEGHDISGIVFDAAGVANEGVRITTCSNFKLSRFSVLNFKNYGLRFMCNSPVAGTISWSSNFKVTEFFISSSVVSDYGAGIIMSGTMDVVSPPGPADPHLFTFTQGRVEINKGVSGPTRGGDFGFVDSGQFFEVDFVGSGGGTLFQPTCFRTSDNPTEPFPANLSFYSCSMQGGTIYSDGLHGPIYMAHFTTGDGEIIPQGESKIYGFTDHGYMFGDWSIERLSKEVIFNGDAAAKRRIRFSTPDNSQEARITHNSSLGLEMEVWTGAAWLLALRLYPDGQVGMNFPGVGFRILGAGGEDSGGAGRRSITIPN